MLTEFWLWLEYLPLASHIGATWWFPLLESLHVVSITLMLGAILMVDLRILAFAALSYKVSTLSRELVPWSVVGYLFACVTGIGMFITRASVHALNPAFQIKMFLMILAGMNIFLMHKLVLRSVSAWDISDQSPRPARLAAAASLILWIGVMLAGRWIGHIV